MAFNMGPSNAGMPDWLRQKSKGNTGIMGGMRNRPAGYGNLPNMGWGRSSPGQDGTFKRRQRPTGDTPFGMGPMPMPERMREPVSTTMPVGRPRPQIIPLGGEGIGTPGQQPIEENQLWRTYNRLLGGQMAPRMLTR